MRENDIKSEELIYSISEIDSRFIEEADPLKMENQAQGNNNDGNTKITRVGRRLPKAAVAAIAVVCILALGGGTVWAMLSSPLKDYFFKDSKDEEFANIYTEIGTEYKIGSHTVTFDGLIYDKSTDTAYVSFSAVDSEGNPAIFEQIYDPDKGNGKQYSISTGQILTNLPPTLNIGFITLIQFKLGDDEGFVIATYTTSTLMQYGESSLFIHMKSYDEYYGGDRTMEIMVLDKEGIERLNEDFKLLEKYAPEEIYYPETGEVRYKVNYDFGRGPMPQEMHEILVNHGLKELDHETFTAQVIEAQNVKFTFGRTEAILEYDYTENDFDQFYIIRENGEKLSVKKKKLGEKNLYWYLESVDPKNTLAGGRTEGKSTICKCQFKYNFILAPDEKVAIEIDGQIYR